MDAIELLSKGLSATRLRVNTIASNIANAEVTRTPEGGPYKRKDVVQVAQPVKGDFGSVLDKMTMAEPKIAGVVEDTKEPRKVYQPGHPDADKEGFVAYPNINIVTTMTDLMSASKLYQADVTAIQTTREMLRQAASISRPS